MRSVSTDPPAPSGLSDLVAAERLVIYGLRRWIVGLGRREAWHWSLAWNAMARDLGGTEARAGLTAVNALVRALAAAARRPFRHHHPCCPLLTADELAVLCLVAACQHDDAVLAAGLSAWLVRPEGAGALTEACAALARTLAGRALALPLRGAPAAGPDTVGPGLPTALGPRHREPSRPGPRRLPRRV